MNLLFLNVGRRCELVERFREALRVRGGGTIWGSDIDPKAPALQLVDRAKIFPHGDTDEFPPFLCSFCNEHGIDLVIPSIDPDLRRLDSMRDGFERNVPDGSLLLPPSDVIQAAADKLESKRVFEAAGLQPPRTLSADEGSLSFPVFVRPRGGSGGEGARKVANQRQLEGILQESPNLIVEEFVDGSEFTVDVLSSPEKEALIALPRKRIRVRGGEAQISLLERNSSLEAHAKTAAEEFGATGPTTIQFIKGRGGDFVPIELNARMGGGLPLSIAAGADWPGWILDLVLGQSISTGEPIADGIVMSRYDQSVFLTKDDLERLE